MRQHEINNKLPEWAKNLLSTAKEFTPDSIISKITHLENSDIQTYALYIWQDWNRYVVILDWNMNYPISSDAKIKIIKII